MGIVDDDIAIASNARARRIALEADVPPEMVPDLEDPFERVDVPLEEYADGECLSDDPPHDLGDLLAELDGADGPDFAGQIRSKLLHGDAILDLPPKAPLIEGLIDQGDTVVMYGRSGGGKTFVALDLAGCVATGNWWHGSEVVAGDVLYIIAEGAQGIPNRWRAWKTKNGLYSAVERMHWLPARVNLRAAHWAQAVADVAVEVSPSLIVIDTMARTFGAGNENSSEDMGAYIAGADTIREATGAAVLIVHHSGKDESSGSRGHSSLLGAVDVEIAIRNGGDGIITIESTKQKDRATPTPRRFVLEPHDESVALAKYDGRNRGDSLTKKATRVLDALAKVATESGVGVTVWKEQAESDGVSKTTFYEARKLLLEQGLVRSLGATDRGPYVPAQDGDDA